MIKHTGISLLFLTLILGLDATSVAAAPLPENGTGIGVTFLRLSELTRTVGGRHIPLEPEQVLKNLARYDAVWLAQDIIHYARPAWNLVRQRAPEKLVLRYNSSVSARLNSKHILDYDYINRYHPEWFLLKDAKDPRKADPRNPDNRIRWEPNNRKSRNYNRFYIDVCNEQFQDWAAQQALNYVSGKIGEFNTGPLRGKPLDYPYDGLALDNVVLRSIKVRFNTPYPNWKYANNLEAWKAGFLSYLRKIHKVLSEHGYILVVNSSYYWDRVTYGSDLYDLMETVDGIMHEWAVGYGTRYWGGEKWLRCIERHEAVVNKGLIDWWVCYPSKQPQLGRKQFMYVYCSFLLVKRPGYSLFYASSDFGEDRAGKIPWYEQYELPLGRPTSKRYQRAGCWFRDYSNARTVVNPAETPRRIVIDGNGQWMDWASKKTVSQLVLPPKSGALLLRRPYTQ